MPKPKKTETILKAILAATEELEARSDDLSMTERSIALSYAFRLEDIGKRRPDSRPGAGKMWR